MNKDVSDMIQRVTDYEKRLDGVTKKVCPYLWHSRGQSAANGYVDTFSCSMNYCTDLLIIRPYGDFQLEKVLRKQCKSANKQGEYPCKFIEGGGKL